MKTGLRRMALCAMALAFTPSAPTSLADELVTVRMYSVSAEGMGASVGTITLRTHRHGVLLIPELMNLAPGLHGFHLHQNPQCGPAENNGQQTAAAAAGGHFDPGETDSHRGPFEPGGHLGDLPALFVSAQGLARQPELAPRLSFGDLDGHSLVIHERGDNYSDHPQPLGGGGGRIACGIVRFE